MERNERKREILDFVDDEGETIITEVARILNTSKENASVLMRRYCFLGLLERERKAFKGIPSIYVYRITEKGRKNLEWLNKNL